MGNIKTTPEEVMRAKYRRKAKRRKKGKEKRKRLDSLERPAVAREAAVSG